MTIVGLLLSALVAHPGPPVWGEMQVGEGEVVFLVQGEPGPLRRCLGIQGELLGPLAEADVAAARAEVAAYFAEHVPIEIDGQRVRPELRGFELPVDSPDEDGWLVVTIRLAYPCQGVPGRIGLVWESFEGTDWSGTRYVPVVIKHEGAVEMTSVWPEEPEFIWHAKELRRREAAEVAPVGAPAAARTLPLVSLVLLAASLVGIAWLRRAGATRAACLSLGLLGLAAAFLCRDLGRVAIPGRGSVRVPAEAQALGIFETLHANVYRAFEAQSEDEIYDLLAVSVDPGLLDELYGEIYESLILREQGGAVCDVDRVEVLERTFHRLPSLDGAPRFGVELVWRVHGIVAHWGHVHRRVNRYHADYTVAHDGRSWKIAAVDVLEHERVDEDG